jgi:hypothetical protein
LIKTKSIKILNPNAIKHVFIYFTGGTSIPIDAVVGGYVGGVAFILIILITIYFIRFKKSSQDNVITKIDKVIYTEDTDIGVQESNGELVTSAPPLAVPCNPIDMGDSFQKIPIFQNDLEPMYSYESCCDSQLSIKKRLIL